jgi:hypothetical protein
MEELSQPVLPRHFAVSGGDFFWIDGLMDCLFGRRLLVRVVLERPGVKGDFPDKNVY